MEEIFPSLELEDVEDESVALEVYEDNNFNELVSDKIRYPCLMIHPITSEEEFLFFRNRFSDESETLPCYCMVDGCLCKVGNFRISLNNLLCIREIYNYDVKLCKSENDVICIKLDDPEFLMKFIHLGEEIF